ncbi:MAG: carboxypeptidase regulatory-like domain-containing protein [Bacteroidota bacterium]
MIRRFAFATAVVALGLAATATPALAHKMKVFASATGTAISGYVYFSGDSRAVDTKVTARGADGSTVFEGVTDDKGQFGFRATRRMDHVITVDGNDGHMGAFTVTAAELPDSLPAAGSTAAAPPASPIPAETVAGSADLRAFIDQSISRQIRPLREQIDAYQEKIWWHDVIGGIGYIVGLAGLAFGWANRKPRKIG